MRNYTIVFLLLHLWPRAGFAQIVNVLPALSMNKLGWGGNASGVLNWKTGNNFLVDVTAEAQVRYAWPKDIVYWIGRSRYAEGKDGPIISQAFEHLRYRREIYGRLSGEIFVQQEYDSFRRINLRALNGIGPRVEVYSTDTVDVAFGTAYMYEYERVRPENDLPSQTHSASRWSNYGQFAWKPEDDIVVQQIVYAQPLFTNMRDIRALSESSLLLKGRGHLAFKVALRIIYDSRPPADVKTTDTGFETSIIFTP